MHLEAPWLLLTGVVIGLGLLLAVKRSLQRRPDRTGLLIREEQRALYDNYSRYLGYDDGKRNYRRFESLRMAAARQGTDLGAPHFGSEIIMFTLLAFAIREIDDFFPEAQAPGPRLTFLLLVLAGNAAVLFLLWFSWLGSYSIRSENLPLQSTQQGKVRVHSKETTK